MVDYLKNSSGVKVNPPEGGTAIVTVAFTDEDDAAVTPTTANWTLSDADGNVINSREEVEISPLSTSVNIVLSGDDLALQSEVDSGRRVFTVEGTYVSNLGSGLPFKKEEVFEIKKLVNV